MPRLLVIYPDPIAPLITKGEITDRYFNPGDFFDDVHVVTTCRDAVRVDEIKRMAGRATLTLHELEPPPRFFWRTLGWLEPLMKEWLGRAQNLGLAVAPDVVRCYGAHINVLAGSVIRNVTGARLVVSLHNRPDFHVSSGLDRLREIALERLCRKTLLRADRVVVVYRSQIPYLERIGIARHDLAYNIINPTSLVRKTNYNARGRRLRVVSVGRLIPGKAPLELLRAVAEVEGIELTIIGDGSLREGLQLEAKKLGLTDRCIFVRSLPNDEICSRLMEWDVFATRCDYPGVPKTVMEAFLVGMPVVLNRPSIEPVPEYDELPCVLVENSSAGYASALSRLSASVEERSDLGLRAADQAWRLWDPTAAEQRYVEIYRECLS